MTSFDILPRLTGFAIDVARLTLWLALLAAIFVPVERICTGEKRPKGGPGLASDVFYYFFNSLVPGMVLALPIAALSAIGARLLPHAYLAMLADLPFVVVLLGALVVGEVGVYWGHRLSHEIPLLWRFHAVHHAPEHMSWLVNTRAHPIDMVFTRICGLAPMYLLGLQSVGRAASLGIAVSLITTVWTFFIHANVRWRFGRLEYLVSTPGFHHWHHTNDGNINKNYAALLPCLDWIFGTIYLPRHWPPNYGIDEPHPTTVGGQLVEPLRRRKKAPEAPAE